MILCLVFSDSADDDQITSHNILQFIDSSADDNTEYDAGTEGH